MATKQQAVSDDITNLRGVGKETAKNLNRLGIHTITDLLFHLPLRYQDRTKIECIRQLKPDQEAVVEGVIQSIAQPKRGRTKLLCELRDDTGTIAVRFFHVFTFQARVLKSGTRMRCYGMVRRSFQGGFEMMHPEYQVLSADEQPPAEAYLTSFYPATEGLSQHMLRKLVAQALLWLDKSETFEEMVPASILQLFTMPTMKEALTFVHQPLQGTSLTDLQAVSTLAQKRLVFEELLAHRASLLVVKRQFQAQASLPMKPSSDLSQAFLSQLPFSLTGAQERVYQEIQQDLQRAWPMLRLVQGDVGCGKTVIAALSMLRAVESGYQAALMAPTELLAEQHYRVFQNWLTPLGVKVSFLSGKIKGAARTKALAAIQQGEAQIIVGTHALFQEEVQFASLALIVIDEHHRFGVEQRASLRGKGGQCPHQLIMTATPIPRTLAMSFYADIDCSIIDELPSGRTPIVTRVLPTERREDVIARIRETCQQGRQVYWVCPLIEESESLACQAAIHTASLLQEQLPGLRVELVHGRMPAEQKEKVMGAFQRGEAQVLVATTVIEVGVDVPNASVMIIDNAERLGLSQLHQLRGRVGRGKVASHCLLLYQQPLSAIAKERLAVLRDTNDGFKIAQRDLELRGPGEVLGTRQTGAFAFRVADLLRDKALLPQVQQAADMMLQGHADLIDALISRWTGKEKLVIVD